MGQYAIGSPTAYAEPGPTLTPWHWESIGGALATESTRSIGACASATWPFASFAAYIPFRLAVSCSFDGMFTINGATAGDSIDVGVYNSNFVRLASKGLTLQVGTSAMQKFAFAAALVCGPGLFYMAVSMNGTTGTFVRLSQANSLRAGGGLQEDLSGAGTPGTLPANATPTAWTPSVVCPIFGLYRTGYTVL